MAPQLPSVRKLLRLYDCGEISPEEFRQQMARHAGEIISEMKEDSLNPVAALAETLICRFEAAKLQRQYGQRQVREVFNALADEDSLPASRYLWNAANPHVPLHTLLRVRRKPNLRIHALRGCHPMEQTTGNIGAQGPNSPWIEVDFEYDQQRRWLRLQRDRRGNLNLIEHFP